MINGKIFERFPDASPPMIMPHIRRKQDWVTPAVEAFWKAYKESDYANKRNVPAEA